MSPSAEQAGGGPASEPVRLQKALAAAGFGSRRGCEQLIAAGRVRVNGRRVELGQRVDPRRDVVTVDGSRVPVAPGLIYLAVNKPRGMLSAMVDGRGRPCVGALVADLKAPVHHVGRLDADSEGLLLLTNDGALSHRLMHPSYGVPKTYLAEVTGPVGRSALRSLQRGVALDDGMVRADRSRLVGAAAGRSVLEITLHEGRKHVVRRMLLAIGHPVTRLVRTAIGPVVLGDLKPGRRRHLQPTEVRALYRETNL